MPAAGWLHRRQGATNCGAAPHLCVVQAVALQVLQPQCCISPAGQWEGRRQEMRQAMQGRAAGQGRGQVGKLPITARTSLCCHRLYGIHCSSSQTRWRGRRRGLQGLQAPGLLPQGGTAMAPPPPPAAGWRWRPQMSVVPRRMLLHAQRTASRRAGTCGSEGVTRQCWQQAFVRRLTLCPCQLVSMGQRIAIATSAADGRAPAAAVATAAGMREPSVAHWWSGCEHHTITLSFPVCGLFILTVIRCH